MVGRRDDAGRVKLLGGGFGFRLSLLDDDVRAVDRQVVELQVEALAVGVRPGGPDRAPVALLALFGHGVNAVARAVLGLAHVMSIRF